MIATGGDRLSGDPFHVTGVDCACSNALCNPGRWGFQLPQLFGNPREVLGGLWRNVINAQRLNAQGEGGQVMYQEFCSCHMSLRARPRDVLRKQVDAWALCRLQRWQGMRLGYWFSCLAESLVVTCARSGKFGIAAQIKEDPKPLYS